MKINFFELYSRLSNSLKKVGTEEEPPSYKIAYPSKPLKFSGQDKEIKPREDELQKVDF